MQKLKLNLERLNNVEVLTRSQLKNVLGGSMMEVSGLPGCCVHMADWSGYQCNLTKAEALSQFHNGDGGWDNWCCSSC